MALMPRVEAIPRILQRPSCLRARPGPGGAGHGSRPRSPGKGCFRKHCACPSYLAAPPRQRRGFRNPPIKSRCVIKYFIGKKSPSS